VAQNQQLSDRFNQDMSVYNYFPAPQW